MTNVRDWLDDLRLFALGCTLLALSIALDPTAGSASNISRIGGLTPRALVYMLSSSGYILAFKPRNSLWPFLMIPYLLYMVALSDYVITYNLNWGTMLMLGIYGLSICRQLIRINRRSDDG